MSENNVQTAPKPQTNIQKFKAAMVAPSVEEQFRNALGENKEAFVASLIDLYNTDTTLQECEPNKVVMEALKAAVLKLPVNKALGFAYILPFGKTPTFILGYKGYLQLAMRTGQYKTINADIVYEGEISEKTLRDNKLTGKIEFDGERISDKVVGYFAYIEFLNGFSKTLYIKLEDMAKHAKAYSPTIKTKNHITVDSLMKLAGKENTGIGWTGGFDDMALKTALRQLLSKYGYLSIEMQNALVSDTESSHIEQPTVDRTIVDIDSEEVKDDKKTEEKPPYMQ